MDNAVWLWVGIGGSIGSLCRYGIARWAGNRFKGVFPWGTLIANITGAFLLGFLQGQPRPEIWLLFLGTGILGGLTTFSTWMLESLRLMEEGEHGTALMNLVCSAAAGMFVFWLGTICAGGIYEI